MNVLIVEDQQSSGLALASTLMRLGHEPRLITSGAAAWELIDREDWRLIVTDWIMPEVDGLELCRRIRARRGRSYQYVIMVTCRTDALDRLEGLKAGADDFLTKPVSEEELALRLAIAQRILGVQAELEAKNARLEAMVNTDPLTGLANRRGLYEVMGGLRSQAVPVMPCALVALDLDHFKSYNEPATRSCASWRRSSGRARGRVISWCVPAARSSSWCCRGWDRTRPWSWPIACDGPSRRIPGRCGP
jgi:two-component system chemotaxis response regulator CheY